MRGTTRHRLGLLASGVLILSLAACGSSAGGSSPSAGSNAPYKLGAIIDLSNNNGTFQPFLESYKADVAAFNARGGADGHPIDLIVCDSQNNANATAACGRQMVSDGVIGVVAVTFGGEYGPYLERADIASSMTLNDTTLLTNPTVFPLFAGGLAGIPGLAAMGADEGCKSMYLIDSASFNPAAQTAIAGQLAGIGKSAHIKTGAIFAPAGAADYSSYISSAIAHGADCIAVEGSGASDEVAMIKDANQVSSKLRVIVPEYLLDPAAISSIGSAIVSKLLIQDTGRQLTATNYPLIKQFEQDQAKYGSAQELPIVGALGAIDWNEVRLFVLAVDHAKTKNAAGVLMWIRSQTDFVTDVEPPINFTKAPPNPLGPSLYSVYGQPVSYRDGKFYDNGPPFDDFTGKPYEGPS